MRNALDTQRIRQALRQKRMNTTDLAREVGVSRQAIYRLLKSGYQPLPLSVVKVARVLELEPWEMLLPGEDAEGQMAFVKLLEKAKIGEARAFELLPAHLSRDPSVGWSYADGADPTTHLLLAGAAAVANALWPGREIEAAVSFHSTRAGNGPAFMFRSKFMPPELVVERTPAPLRQQNVFGVFDLVDFRRHLAWN